MKQIIFFLKTSIVLVFSLLFCLSCKLENLFFYETIDFFIQDGQDIRSIVFINDKNQIQEIEKNQILKLETKNNSFSLKLKKNEITPVLVYFENQFFPHGTVYPYSTTISYSDGFTSKILFRFLNETECLDSHKLREYVSSFNWEKFSEKIQSFENPWNLNQQIILESLATKTFSAKSFQLLQLE